MIDHDTPHEPRKRRPPFGEGIPEETWRHLRAAQEEMRRSWEALMPPGFVEHRRAARRELLLAARSVIDAALRRMPAREPGPDKTTQV
jgi:hypothetical protein